MSFFSRLFGSKRKEENKMDAVFERINLLINDDEVQNKFTPALIRELMMEGGAVDEIPGAIGPFGRSPGNPIPVNGPKGEVTYLSRLLTNSGGKIFFHRMGSISQEKIDGTSGTNNLDVYELLSDDGNFWDILYLDMYHTRKTRKAPSGYKLQEKTLLLRGTSMPYPQFPKDFYPFLMDMTERAFGFPISDPEAKLVSSFTRPLEQDELISKILNT